MAKKRQETGGSVLETSRSSFSLDETKRLIELYEENRALLTGTDKKCGAESRRKAKWEEVTRIINSEFGKNFSVNSVKNRWQNVKSDAKQAMQGAKKVRKKTGGGSPESEPQLTETQQAIVNLEEETAAFSGIPGALETSLFQKEEPQDLDEDGQRNLTALNAAELLGSSSGNHSSMASSSVPGQQC